MRSGIRTSEDAVNMIANDPMLAAPPTATDGAAPSEEKREASVEENAIGLLRQGVTAGTDTIGRGALQSRIDLEQGLRDARTSLTDASTGARADLTSGYTGAEDILRTSGATQAGQLDATLKGAVDPLTNYSRQGLQQFEQGQTSALRGLNVGGQTALDATRTGSSGATEAIGSGFGEARNLGSNFVQAGNTGLSGLQDYVGADSPFLQRKLDRSQQAIDTNLASKGLYGSTGGVQLVGEGAQNILEADEQQRLNVLSQLTGYGANQTGTQQNLATQEALAQADILRGQGLTEAQIAQQLSTQQAGINQNTGATRLQTNLNLGSGISGLNRDIGLTGAQNTGTTGANIAGLRTGGGTALANVGMQTGTGLSGLNVAEGTGVADIHGNTANTIGTMQTAQGAQEAGILTHQKELEAEMIAADKRARNAKRSSMFQTVGAIGGTVAGAYLGNPALGAKIGQEGGKKLAE